MRGIELRFAALALGIASCAAAGEDAVGKEAMRLVSQHVGVFTSPPRRVPHDLVADGPILGNGDVGVVLGGPPEQQTFCIGKNDFWSYSLRHILTVGGVTVSAPALAGASYRQEQDIARAEVRGTFGKDAATLQTRSWVAATENLLVTELSCTGPAALEVRLEPFVGQRGQSAADGIRDSRNPINIGREQHGGGRWYFHGLIDDVRIYGRALSPEEVKDLAALKDVENGLVRRWTFDDAKDAAEGKIGKALKCDGKSTFVDAGQLKVTQAITISAWICPESFQPHGGASYLVSKGEWSQAFSLGLSAGKLRMAIGSQFAQTPQDLALKKWQHVAGTFDGSIIKVFLDGVEVQGSASESEGQAAHGADGDVLWFARRADPEAVKNGRTVAVAVRLVGASATVGAGRAVTFALKPGQRVAVVSAILSDLDAPAPLAAAKKRVAALQPADLDALNAKHQAWWREFWAKSFVNVGDPLLEKFYYGSHYIMASCSRAGKVPPGLFGNWITTDTPAWAGDFHLNYNHEAPFWGLYSSNHVEVSDPYDTPILEALPKAREYARKELNCRGVYYPVGLGPWGIISGAGASFWGQKSNAAYVTTNMIMRFYHTYDIVYLKKVAYPFLREVGDFWEDYLKFENGRYVIYNDAIHEGHTPQDMNALLSLGLVRTLFKSLADMSKELGADADRREKWQHIHDHLSPFPLQERAGKTVFRYSEKGQDWFSSNTLGIQHIWPAGAVGLDSDPKLLEICRDTITVLGRWVDGNGFPTFYTAAARVGYDPSVILTHLREQCLNHSFPNLFLFYGGGGIECCSAVPSCLNEMLLQSHEGVLRLFPCWPKGKAARFGHLRACGAFLVSAELKDGHIQPVRIASERGRDCTLLNPWPGRRIRLLRDGKGEETLQGDRVTFKTRPGDTVTLAPAD